MPRRKPHQYWVAYPQQIARVTIKRKGTGGRKLKKPMSDPFTVVDDDENEFVIDMSDLYETPMDATTASIELARKLGVTPMDPDGNREENPVDLEDEDEDDDDFEEEDEDEDDLEDEEDEGDYEDEEDDEDDDGEEDEEDDDDED